MNVVYQISKGLVKRGHEVFVYTTDAKDFNSRVNMSFSNVIDGIKVYRFRNLFLIKKLKLFITPKLIFHARNEVKTFDIIHFHEYTTYQNVIVWRYAKINSIPYVLQAHGSLYKVGSWQKLKSLYDVLWGYRLLHDASSVIALNNFEAEQYRRMGVPREKIAIIPNGIDLTEYAKLPNKGCFKRKFGIPEKKKIILYLGRIHKTKGIDFLIKAYAHLTTKLGTKDTVLVIAGPDDGYLKEIKTLVKSLNASNSVVFTGPLYGADKLATYVDAYVYVLPSRYETFPMTVLEAFACGKPVIASNICGLEDLVKNGNTGLLFELGNTDQLAECIQQLFNDGKKAEEMGLNSRRVVEDNFAIDKIVTSLEELYKLVSRVENTC